jgi:hypothetical protein
VTDHTAFVLKLLVTALVAAALSVLMQARAASDPSRAGENPMLMESGLEAFQ